MAEPVPMKSTRTPNTKTATEMARFTRERAPLSLESLRKTAAGKMNAIGVAVRQPYKRRRRRGAANKGMVQVVLHCPPALTVIRKGQFSLSRCLLSIKPTSLSLTLARCDSA